ncbi:hypothetical protein Esti_000561 [Eimeria stiedai]
MSQCSFFPWRGRLVRLLLPLVAACLLQQQQQVAAQVLGIDLGSEFIKAAVVAPGKRMELLLSSSSSRKFPNAISFVEKGTCSLTEEAVSQSHKNPAKVFQAPSLFLGLAASELGELVPPQQQDAAAAVQCSNGSCSSSSGLARVQPKDGLWPGGLSAIYYPWEVYASPSRGSVLFKVREDLLLPPEVLVAAVLSSIRQTAAAAAQLSPSAVLGAVVSVPCRYTQRQRAALRDSLEIAGFKVLGLVSHGAAAGVQHALDTYDAAAAAAAAGDAPAAARTEKKLAFNVGSSSVDAALIAFQVLSPSSGSSSSSSSQNVPLVCVLGCSSHTMGGGRAVDLLLAESLRETFDASSGETSLSGVPKALKKLEKQAAATKKVLSANKQAFVRVEGLFKGKDLVKQVQREALEELLQRSPLLQQMQAAADGALAAAHHSFEEMDAVELLGGGWRVPKVLETIHKWGNEAKTKTHLNGDEAMATGAAFVAANSTAIFRVKKLLLQDGSPFTYSLRFIGLEDHDEQQEQQQEGVVKVLVAPHKKLGGTKRVFVRSRADFTVEVLEDEQVISTHVISGVHAAHEKRQQDLEAERSKQQQQEQQVQVLEDDKEPPKAELVFSVDAAGVIELAKASLIFERTTYTPNKQETKEAPTDAAAAAGKDAAAAAGKDAAAAAGKDAAAAGEAKKCEDPNSPECEASAAAEGSSSSSSSGKGKRTVQTFPYALSFSSKQAKPLPLTTQEKQQLKELLQQQEARNLAAKQLSEGLNALETFLYQARSAVNEGTLDAVTDDAFRQDLLQQLQQTEDWVYGTAAADGLAAVTKRLSDLREAYDPAVTRAREAELRPSLIVKTDKLLQDVEERLDQYVATRPWISEAKIAGVRSQRKEVLAWWEEVKAKQAAASPLVQPVFTEAQVVLKLKELQQRLKALEKIPKPTTTTTTTTASTSSGAEQQQPDADFKQDQQQQQQEQRQDRPKAEAETPGAETPAETQAETQPSEPKDEL